MGAEEESYARARAGKVAETVHVEEMDLDEETESAVWPCRCSGTYSISLGELAQGVQIVNCSSCSLAIRVCMEEE